MDELKQALVENLENRGVLGKLKAQVRAEVFRSLEGTPETRALNPPISNENLLINELVRDYLSYNGYGNALSVFMAESGQPSDRALDRDFLRDELGLTEQRDDAGDRALPLLYGITHALKAWKNDGVAEEDCREGSGSTGGNSRCSGAERGPPRVAMCPCNDGSRNGQDGGARNGRSNAVGLQDPAPVMFFKQQG